MGANRDPLLRTLLIWTTLLTSVLVWLPIVRGAMNGESYRWMLVSGIGGRGVGGSYWMLLVALAYFGTLQVLGRRKPGRLFAILLLLFLAACDAAVLYAAWKHPGALRFEGATFGIDVSLVLVAPLLFTVFLLLGIIWATRHWSVEIGMWPAWTRMNGILLGIAGAMAVAELVLFRYGGAGGNQLGVIMTIAQWFVLNAGLNRYLPARETLAA
jgi:hypothetical protein